MVGELLPAIGEATTGGSRRRCCLLLALPQSVLEVTIVRWHREVAS